jgi:hypothetical protein
MRPTVVCVSAPTLWEEGRMSGSRTTRLAVLASVLVIGLDVAATGRVGVLFDLAFVLVCVAAALAVRPADFFTVGVLPPILLLCLCTALSVLDRSALAARGDGFVQGLVSGLAHHAGALAAGYALALGVLAMRHRVMQRRSGRQAVNSAAAEETGYSNRPASPAPYLTTSGTPDDRSTTVVGSEPHSPESTTASNA